MYTFPKSSNQHEHQVVCTHIIRSMAPLGAWFLADLFVQQSYSSWSPFRPSRYLIIPIKKVIVQ